MFGTLTELVTTFAIIADIVGTASQLLTDDASIMLPHHQSNARRRIGKYLHSTERADALLQVWLHRHEETRE